MVHTYPASATLVKFEALHYLGLSVMYELLSHCTQLVIVSCVTTWYIRGFIMHMFSRFGFTLNKMVCLGFVRHAEGECVTPQYILQNANFEIDIAGRRVPAHASLQPPKMPVARMDGVASYRPRSRGIITQKII